MIDNISKDVLEETRTFFLSADSPVRLGAEFSTLFDRRYLRVPTNAFRHWRTVLENITALCSWTDSARSSSGTRQLVCDQLKSEVLSPLLDGLLAQTPPLEQDEFARVIVLISIQVIHTASQVTLRDSIAPRLFDQYASRFVPGWFVSGSSAPSDSDRSPKATLDLLELLYAKDAQHLVSGPLRYLHIALACKFLPFVFDRTARISHGLYRLDEYFNALELMFMPDRRVRTYHIVGLPASEEEDWCFRYLAHQLSSPYPSQIWKGISIPPAAYLKEQHGLWKEVRNRFLEHELNVVITGPPRSGKTSIRNTLQSALDHNVQLGPAIDLLMDISDPEYSTIDLGKNNSISLASWELRTLTELIQKDEPVRGVQATHRTPLGQRRAIALLLPSTSFAAAPPYLLTEEGRKTVNDMKHLLLSFDVSAGPQYQLALVYTMCDQFGVVMSGDLRMIETSEHFNAFRDLSDGIQSSEEGRHQEMWEKFLTVICDREEEEDLQRLRRILLEGSRDIWELAARKFEKERLTINAYMTQATTVGENLRRCEGDFPASGIAQMFADFLVDFS